MVYTIHKDLENLANEEKFAEMNWAQKQEMAMQKKEEKLQK